MRWDEQVLNGRGGDHVTDGALFGMPGLVRSVSSPEFAGVRFHEVRARSVLNKVPGSSGMPFRWTVNPYRGCTHACRYCFARNSHTYLDLNAGEDFDREVVVKVNAAEVLGAQLRKPSWTGEHVAMGTNTDPYQRAEGRYRLMPGIIRELTRSATPFSILTKGTTLNRDLPLLREAAASVAVGLGVSLTLLDHELQRGLEPGTPSPRARLELVRNAAEAGLRCQVFVAPVLPGLTDSEEQLDRLFEAIAAAGATNAVLTPLHLRPGAREWFMNWLACRHPELVPYYEQLYSRGSNVAAHYRRWLSERGSRLLHKHGLVDTAGGAVPARGEPHGRSGTARGHRSTGEQMSLL